MGEAAILPARTTSGNPRKPTKRLTQEEIGLMLKLRQDGLTQVQIAQRLDCDQKAVSVWLHKLTDSTDIAKSYLRGSALRMAENIVKRGLPRDHVAALKGLNVLEEERSNGLVIQIGIKDSDVTINLSPGESGTSERRSVETLAIPHGSDNSRYVNQLTPSNDSTLATTPVYHAQDSHSAPGAHE